MGDCADITMGIGALPVMACAREEVEEMVEAARGVVLNLGTLSPARVDAMLALGRKAREKNIPIVLDPVGVGATRYRTEMARLILKEVKPSIIKGNSAEIISLAGLEKPYLSGVQCLQRSPNPLPDAESLLKKLHYGAVVAVTGPVDLVTDGQRTARVYNGHRLLPLVVGSGCMAASLVAAFAAVEADLFLAATAALSAMSIAGEAAARGADGLGPAEFKKRLLDALYFLTPQELDRRARVEIQ